MKATQTKSLAPAQKAPFSIRRSFDKWFLPIVFVAIGSLIGWALWRH
jgi:hypothetical protein